ncbi:DUF3850 domain-containing protein [Brucella sp. 2280]|uniref:DUF3850 domain-containing protein n=1 Tax=Brucella sp. 2280 TaxID=2592625 RepID=UPI0012965DA9|nr:DUF3850 domain-containing protein [Brucella sp. 2280]QGA58250.1 DUF3850 domain-containing protein [Brucella sp. 2280]
MASEHTLKIDAQPMDDLLSGAKTGEVRKDDRGFQVGDTVRLTCADGRTVYRVISHIQRGYGLPDGICVLSYTTPTPVDANSLASNPVGDKIALDTDGNAPAAADMGLVTVHTQVRFGQNDIWRNEVFVGERSRITERRELVTRSQAEELLAAERAVKEEWKGRARGEDVMSGPVVPCACASQCRAVELEQRLEKATELLRQARGLSGILCLRRLSLDYKTLAENDSELSFCLEPFTRRPFPVASCLIEHEI